jgi:multidrug transporter EmrE-like cation transporter
MMISSAAFWSASSAADKWSLTCASPAAHGVVQGVVIFVLCAGGLVLLGRQKRLSGIIAERRTLALAVLVFVAALGLQWLAFADVWVGVVEALKRAIGATGALVVGRIVFDEQFHAPRVVAAVGMAVGAAMVVLG